jgi:hypothetical protein
MQTGLMTMNPAKKLTHPMTVNDAKTSTRPMMMKDVKPSDGHGQRDNVDPSDAGEDVSSTRLMFSPPRAASSTPLPHPLLGLSHRHLPHESPALI